MEYCRSKKHLSNSEIIEVIQSYISETLYNYAIMIDGNWGCGKTYFVKEELIPKLKELKKEKSKSRKFIYVSLYGINSVEDINKQIYMESYLNSEKKKKSFSFGSSAMSIGFDLLKNNGINISENNIRNFLEQFLSLGNSVLIFDDLERCNIPINEVLGYINGFVEHQKMKVIIIANQEEINREFDKNNIELKYMVVLNEKYDANNNESNSATKIFEPREKDNENIKFSKEDLDNRLKELFIHQSEYEKIREKLVGTTIYYYPDLDNIMKAVINDADIETELKKMIQDKITGYINIMKKLKHYNIRTFQFYLSKINFLYHKIKILDMNTEEFLNYLIGYCFNICCLFKKGDSNYLKERYSDSPEDYIFNINVFSFNYPFRIKFVDDYIIYSHLDETNIDKVINKYNKNYGKEAKDSKKVLNDLGSRWVVYNQKKVEESLNMILKYLSDNMYDLDDYIIIINLFLSVQNIGFDSQYVERMKKSMQHNIECSSKYCQFDKTYASMISNKDIKEQFHQIIEQLQTKMDESTLSNEKKEVQRIIFNNINWVSKIYQLTKNSGRYSSYTVINIFNYINISDLASKIIDSTPMNLLEFRRLLQTLNDDIGTNSDYQSYLSQLYNTLYKQSSKEPGDLVAKAQFQWLKKDLERNILKRS